MFERENTLSRFIIRHLMLLALALVILAGVYLLYRNTTSVVFSAIILVLAHIAAVGVLFFLGRGLLRRLFRKLHGLPAADDHTHAAPETEGATIDWPSLYDVLVKIIFLGKERQFREGVVDLARIQAGETVLDVGCGTGTFAIIAKQKGGPDARIVATDAAPEMIAKARQDARKAAVDVDFRVGLAEAMDFPDNTFDVVMNSFMVHHLPGDLKARAFAEMYRVLKPGGRLLVVDFEPPRRGLSRLILRLLLGAGMMQIDNTRYVPVLEQAGFSSVEMGSAGHALATAISAVKR